MENLIGKKIIDFTLPAYCKGKFTTVSSQSLLGNWAVFMFYPADFTFVCPTELADLGKLYSEFQEIGCRVFSVSTDSEFVHKAWVALRGSFVVDPDGIIKAYEVHDNSIGRDASELLRKVQAAQFTAAHGDQVCPAKWRPGEKTLYPSIDLVGKI